ncbi:MAG: heavy metal translocating P-type ATPase [Proteobacteria bacterium]|nr:MAG: heavy metal translocating P-type ATPase [Pseudomonadota bacterium]
MNDIVVKSYVKGRARLKSKYFNQTILEKISCKLSSDTLYVRKNPKCKSLIVHFDENHIRLNDILLLASSFIKPKIDLSLRKSQNISCSGLACSVCHPQTDLKKPTLAFGSLSLYALAMFAGVSLPTSLTLGVCLVASVPLLKDAYKDIKQKRFTLQTFMSLSLIGATFLGEVQTAFEVIYILRGGMLLEEYVAKQSKSKIHSLLQSDIKKAYILVDDMELECSLDEIKIGDIVVVRSGEKIPVDGTITKGKAEISEALINGRSEPIFKEVGDRVYSNTLVEKGRIFIHVDTDLNDTYLAHIINQVEFSLANRSDSEKAADILASRLLKLGTFLTIGTFLLTGSFLRAFSVMIVMSCPCSTILAASTAISASVARGAKEGILIKGGEYLERFGKSDVVCFDKTGTLTTGKPLVVDLVLADGVDKQELFGVACKAEYRNTHPIALSIVEYGKKLNIHVKKQVESELLPGLGAKLKDKNDTILVGNSSLLRRYKVALGDFKKKESLHVNQGRSVVYVSKNKKILGFIAFEHEARENAKNVVSQLKKRGVKKVVLLTGDDEKVAHAFSEQYGFDEVWANVMPKQKAKIVEDLKKEYKIVSMIGDGINDTIAMSKADIGISFASGGSEAAIEVSDIAIINSNIEDVIKLHDISTHAHVVVNQNYWIGTSTNFLGVALASVGLLSPVGAGALHIAHTIGIMANASRIALKKG